MIIVWILPKLTTGKRNSSRRAIERLTRKHVRFKNRSRPNISTQRWKSGKHGFSPRLMPSIRAFKRLKNNNVAFYGRVGLTILSLGIFSKCQQLLSTLISTTDLIRSQIQFFRSPSITSMAQMASWPSETYLKIMAKMGHLPRSPEAVQFIAMPAYYNKASRNEMTFD